MYAAVIKFRHFLFDRGWMKSAQTSLPSICIGNLEVGGTGKTPHTMFFTDLLRERYNVAILSRGYGRKSKGFKLAKTSSTANDVGDEALSYAQRWKDVTVAVCNDRTEGIEELKHIDDIQVVLLDDAICRYENRFTHDLPLPAGRLRDLPSRAEASDAIVVSKCPGNMSEKEMDNIASELSPYSQSPVFFSYFKYKQIIKEKKYLLVTGIAQTEELLSELRKQQCTFQHKRFGDHFNYTQKDADHLLNTLSSLGYDSILTTQKDYVKLSTLLPRTAPIEVMTIEVGWHKSPENWVQWFDLKVTTQRN